MLDPKLVQDKLNYCQDYLKAMDIVDPGLSHNRGRTLWEMYSVKAFVLSQKWTSHDMSKEDFKNGIKELVPMLEEVKRCLMYCGKGTFEFHVFKLADKTLINTKETLTFIDFM